MKTFYTLISATSLAISLLSPQIALGSEANSLFGITGSTNKTEGHYFGLDYVNMKLSMQEIAYSSHPVVEHRIVGDTDIDSNNSGLGLSYKYAFNFNSFFIAPGVFIEQNQLWSPTKTGDDNGTSVKIRNRYGFMTNFGYDINNFISPYISLGYIINSYETQSSVHFSGRSYNNVRSNKSLTGGEALGFGTRIKLTDNLGLNAEYIYQKFSTKTNLDVETEPFFDKKNIKVRTDTVKVGLSYKF